MHPRVRTTSAFEREKSAKDISPLFPCPPNTVGVSLVARIFLFPPSPPPLLLAAYLFHPLSLHSSFQAFCSSLVNLSFAGLRLEANGKARKYRKGGLTKHLKASREKNIDKELEKRDVIESDR